MFLINHVTMCDPYHKNDYIFVFLSLIRISNKHLFEQVYNYGLDERDSFCDNNSKYNHIDPLLHNYSHTNSQYSVHLLYLN